MQPNGSDRPEPEKPEQMGQQSGAGECSSTAGAAWDAGTEALFGN